MEIIHVNNDRNGHFDAIDGGKTAGTLVYAWAGTTKLIIEHTEADPAYKGKGVGKILVYAAVEYAREHGVKILPLCPFAKALFDRTPAIGDVLS